MQDNKKQDKEQYPGYPPAKKGEDITDPQNGTQKVSMDPDEMGANARSQSAAQRSGDIPASQSEEQTDADVTNEDLQLLSAADQNRDMDDQDLEEAKLDNTDEDGDPLNEVINTYGQAGADLDVPGSEEDDANEDIGEEDEENNYYSLGGDNHENLEEDNEI